MCSLLRNEPSICGFRFWHTTYGTAEAFINLDLLQNVVLTELICAVDFLTSRQIMASLFGIILVERILGIL